MNVFDPSRGTIEDATTAKRSPARDTHGGFVDTPGMTSLLLRAPLVTTIGLIVVAIVVLAIAPTPAAACSCSFSTAPCESMYRGPTFVGKAVKVTGGPDHPVTTFAVEEVFSGKLGASVTVSSGGPCGLAFVIGKRYIVYAHGTPDKLSTGMCSRTRLVEDAAIDLAYGRNPPVRDRAEVTGRVTMSETARGQLPDNIELRVHGTSITTTTTAGGGFRVSVPPGEYTLEVVKPAGLAAWNDFSPPFTVPTPAACAQTWLAVGWNGQIRGRVVDAAGKPVAGVEVGAQPFAGGDELSRRVARSGADGGFAIRFADGGKYRVGVSMPGWEVTPDSPYPTSYYTKGTSQVAAVDVPPGGSVDGIDVVVGKPRDVHLLSGAVRTLDGKPAPDAIVTIWRQRTNSTQVPVDATGHFAVKQFAGETIQIEACATANKRRGECVALYRKLSGPISLELRLPR